MRERRFFGFCVIVFAVAFAPAQAQLKPFDKHPQYFGGTNYTAVRQHYLDSVTLKLYAGWKAKYIKHVPAKNYSYAFFTLDGEKGKVVCQAEGQGYAMVIVAQLAKNDPEAQHIYDDLYRYYRAHPSTTKSRGQKTSLLIASSQNANGQNVDGTAATDGDLEIAYSLLLADKQWGSKKGIDYLQSAKALITEIMRYEINPKTWTILEGDDEPADSGSRYLTRTSDFMPVNLKAFKTVGDSVKWQRVIDAEYRLFLNFQKKYSPGTGLVPDFIINLNTNPVVPKGRVMEAETDGDYSYNACRVPWRIGADYLLSGDERAKAFLTPLNKWIKAKTGGNPRLIVDSYQLNGAKIKDKDDNELFFTAPFAVAALSDGKDSIWAKKLQDIILSPQQATKDRSYNYFGETIRLMDLLIISKNFWTVEMLGR